MARARLGYISEFDGLRCVAIVAVFLIHLRESFFPTLSGFHGGVLGVDLFFALSGFLITTLLLEERATTGSIRLRRFYARRVLRLLPAILVAIALAGIVAYAVGEDGSAKPFWQVALLGATVSNWFVNELGILGHTWSLGLEEQYYLMWSFTLVFLLRRSVRPARVAAVLSFFAVAMAVARWWGVRQSPVPEFVESIGRVDGLLLGSALAFAFASWLRTALKPFFEDRRVVGVALAGAALAAWLARSDSLQSVYDACFLANVCFVVLVGHAALQSETSVNRVLRSRPLRHVGRISYGLYLFHLPVFVAVVVYFPGNALIRSVSGILLTYAVAWASYRFVESPVLRLKSRLGRSDAPTAHSVTTRQKADVHTALPKPPRVKSTRPPRRPVAA